jgi:hypothetical protein
MTVNADDPCHSLSKWRGILFIHVSQGWDLTKFQGSPGPQLSLPCCPGLHDELWSPNTARQSGASGADACLLLWVLLTVALPGSVPGSLLREVMSQPGQPSTRLGGQGEDGRGLKEAQGGLLPLRPCHPVAQAGRQVWGSNSSDSCPDQRLVSVAVRQMDKGAVSGSGWRSCLHMGKPGAKCVCAHVCMCTCVCACVCGMGGVSVPATAPQQAAHCPPASDAPSASIIMAQQTRDPCHWLHHGV